MKKVYSHQSPFSHLAIKRLFWIAVFVLSLSTPAFAATYYVDATNGNDATGIPNDITHPFKTIAKINSLPLAAGDYVKFKRGQCWREQIICSWSGSPGKPITFTSYGSGAKPIIHGGTIINGEWQGPNGNNVYTISYANGWVYGILEDNRSLGKASDESCYNGRWYYDSVNIYYKPTSGTPSNHTVDRLTRGTSFAFTNGAKKYIQISYINFVGNGLYNSTSSMLSNITISRCDFTNCVQGAFLQTISTIDNGLIVFTNCTFNCTGVNLYIVSNNNRRTRVNLSHNIIRNSNKTGDGGSWGGGDRDGFSLQNLVNSKIEYNEISGKCHGSAAITHWIGPGVSATGNFFRYNYIHDIEGAGIIHGGEDVGTANCIIAYNIIKNFGKGPSGPHGGIRLNRPQTVTMPSEVYNNVIANGDVSIYLKSRTDNYIINNNISFNPVLYHLINTVSATSNNIFDNNNYYPDMGMQFQLSNGKDYDFTYWKTISGQERNSLTTDPAFLTATGNDYHLDQNSPCIGIGIYLGQKYDFAGIPVTQFMVNMGAFQ